MHREIEQPGRRTLRLRGYGYTDQGPYFLTIATQERNAIFGCVVEGNMQTNEVGRIIRDEWLRSAEIRPEFWFDAFVVMPNHLHAILAVAPPETDASSLAPASDNARLRRPAHSLGSFVGGFKSATTRRINQARGTPGAKVWQRNYYEHIIRNDRSLEQIRAYIETNPLRWELDRENPDRSR